MCKPTIRTRMHVVKHVAAPRCVLCGEEKGLLQLERTAAAERNSRSLPDKFHSYSSVGCELRPHRYAPGIMWPPHLQLTRATTLGRHKLLALRFTIPITSHQRASSQYYPAWPFFTLWSSCLNSRSMRTTLWQHLLCLPRADGPRRANVLFGRTPCASRRSWTGMTCTSCPSQLQSISPTTSCSGPSSCPWRGVGGCPSADAQPIYED